MNDSKKLNPQKHTKLPSDKLSDKSASQAESDKQHKYIPLLHVFVENKAEHDKYDEESKLSDYPAEVSEDEIQAHEKAVDLFETYTCTFRMNKSSSDPVDSFDFVKFVNAKEIVIYDPTNSLYKRLPSFAQLITLHSFGIKVRSVKNAGFAKRLIDLLAKRRDENLATPKQVRLLVKFGFMSVGTWSNDKSDRTISLIANNGWKVPDDVDLLTY